MMTNYTIYALSSSENNIVKYIGQTRRNLKDRLREHIYDAKHPLACFSPNSHKNRWIRKVLEQGYNVQINEVETTEKEFVNEREIYWISYFGRKNLVNGTDGGENVSFSKKNNNEYIDIHRSLNYLRKNIINY